jgi:hypothetical protein
MHKWLDELLCTQISNVFADEWTLEHVETKEEYNEKHGSCIRCTYRFVWNEDATRRVLPMEHGDALMRLIKNAAKRAKAELVATKIKSRRDFCDWGWTPEGEALMWIFLDPIEKKNKKKKS